jgi:mycothiol synthase
MRPPTFDDAPAVAAMIAACQAVDDGTPSMTADELIGDWAGLNLNEEATLILNDSGEPVACADLYNRRYVQLSVYAYVHPEHRGRGLGSALVRWGEEWQRARWDRAPEGTRVIVQHYIRSTNKAARHLMTEQGYRHVRTVFVMEIVLDTAPVAPKPPTGITLRDFVPGQDERAVFDVVESAFRDSWERPPGEYETWLGHTERVRRDPDLWTLAVDDANGTIVGTCLGNIAGTSGWVAGVGVRRPWRGRGLALAMLRRTFTAFHRRGISKIGLSVDSESSTGAPRLYARAGMHVTEDYLLHRKELRPGTLLLGDDTSAQETQRRRCRHPRNGGISHPNPELSNLRTFEPSLVPGYSVKRKMPTTPRGHRHPFDQEP